MKEKTAKNKKKSTFYTKGYLLCLTRNPEVSLYLFKIANLMDLLRF